MYTIKEASDILGVSISTLRRWEKEGKITSSKTSGGHRRYSIEDLSKYNKKPVKSSRLTIVYCRVSSADQKRELARQVQNVSQYCIAKSYSFKVIEDLSTITKRD